MHNGGTWWTTGLLLVALAQAAVADEGKALFNGRDLAGWEVVEGDPAAWKAKDGMLVCTGGGGGWISTVDQYGDFELELEYRVPPGGNSGVFLRAPRSGNPAFAGMEIQVLDDYAQQYENLMPSQYTGSVYGVAAAKPRATKPAGQWQSMKIVCRGPQVQVTLNGTPVVNANLAEHQDKLAEHPGIARSKGYVGLQNHGSGLEYRNIKLRESR
jgi:hypothetical protein